MITQFQYRVASLATAALLSAACATDSSTGPIDTATDGTFTVNATTGWQYFSLQNAALVTPTPSAAESSAWDIAFFATNVTVNGGAAGPGGVSAACICQNAAATGDQILAMTPASELADFDAVTAAPAGITWQTDVLTPAIDGWLTGTGTAATVDPAKTWLVRLSDSLSYAIVRVQSNTGATATSAGIVTLEWRLQSSETAPLGAVQTLAVDLTSAGAQLVDLNTGALTTDAAAWDLRLEGTTIRVNGGISGSGKAGAATTATAFADLTTAVTMANAYRIDTYSGVFGTNPYYRYDIAGDHRISPSFDVYLVHRGSVTYKLQIINYYSATGAARVITFRWKRLD